MDELDDPANRGGVHFRMGVWSNRWGFKSSAEALRMWRFARSIGITPEAYLNFLKAEARR